MALAIRRRLDRAGYRDARHRVGHVPSCDEIRRGSAHWSRAHREIDTLCELRITDRRPVSLLHSEARPGAAGPSDRIQGVDGHAVRDLCRSTPTAPGLAPE